MINVELFHSLEAEKICFKPLSMNHVKAIHSYASDKEVSRFIGWKLMNSIDETRQHVKTMLERESSGTHLYASVAIKSTGEIIGTAMLFNFDKVANQGFELEGRLKDNYYVDGKYYDALQLGKIQ